ncbi:hypothetical protein RhiirC2_777497 [Rhizophagus irregularis]|uniref:Uncharacterized protein n=1 Tax=Rhizophagus irregularis TaxID=588596 RepID=A0A2N1NE61_9GLOM|nr:hypothetical protein RhiirC2_777497 [Rhizophagus irregularis]
MYLRKKDLEISIKIARTYVTNIQLAVSYENDQIALFEVKYSETIKNLAFTLCKFEKNCCKQCDNSLDLDHSDIIYKGISKT